LHQPACQKKHKGRYEKGQGSNEQRSFIHGSLRLYGLGQSVTIQMAWQLAAVIVAGMSIPSRQLTVSWWRK
jgi:hypothetical protein